MPVAPQRQSQQVPAGGRIDQLMRLRCAGYTYDRIGRELGVGRSTVGTYMQIAFGLLGVHSSTEACLRWQEQRESLVYGLVEGPGYVC